ncbi:MAG: SusD/RagB family nutrient-binding outer membrane lipoprotein [Gemmatimonadaceae bacterium]|nr:SusD/RagB family nutrient-binding outer membrane lipoprotein [Gemmatimonadaceae bacterium]
MARHIRALSAACLLVVAGACNSFLTGDKLDSDPNRATSAQAAQLFVASQVNSYYILSGHAARVLAMWSQQMAGTDRQYIGYDQYSVTEGLFGEFTSVYTGGGLIDHRSIQADALANGNRTLVGIDKVWEALVVSFAADNYGDVPYSQAVSDSVQRPKLDPQLSVYAALQTLLDGAIVDLQANKGVVGSLDLSLNGNNAAWIKVARSLKARLYMHTAEVSNGAYALALAQAQQGISAPSGDLNSRHKGPSGTGEENIWWQFIFRDRDSYIRPGKFLVDLMVSRNDPRLPAYFSKNATGAYGGAAPGQGLDVDKHSNISDTRLVPDFSQPIVTWAETQSIIAEAAYRTGNLGLARSAMDAVRGDAGLAPIGGSLSGAALLKQILEEKYIALFQNPEVFQDYKRTCYPNLKPATASALAGIPARFTYPVAERSANPDNIPDVNAQPKRNANDPANATSVDGTACLGQK